MACRKSVTETARDRERTTMCFLCRAHVPARILRLAALAGGVVLAALSPRPAAAQQPSALQAPASDEISPRLLRSFDEIWALPDAEQKAWHRARFEYTVYYYDPLWMALWGRCGEADSYLSFGPKRFPIRPGQRLLIEGLIQPARGMRLEEPKVTVLAEDLPLEITPTAGQIGRADLFNKRLVAVEGLVDRQVVRDANHLEFGLISEGRLVSGQLLVRADEPVPQLKGSFVKARGVYFGRSDGQGAATRIELWVQRREDIEVTGAIDRDPRFVDAVISPAELKRAQGRAGVHVAGVVRSVEEGRSVTLETDGVILEVQTPQVITARAGDAVEAIGTPEMDQDRLVLRRALLRPAQIIFTSVAELWRLPEAERQRRCRVRLEFSVYFYDPAWKALWGHCGESDDYLSLGNKVFPIKPGQRVLIEGSIVPANNMVVEDAKVTVLGQAEPFEAVPATGEIGNFERFQKKFVAVEGYVDRQQTMDARHLHLDLLVEGRPVIGRVLLDEGAPMPDWNQARLRLRGVYSATQDPTSARPSLEIWTHGPANVEVLGTLADDHRFDRAATPIEQLATLTPGTLVKVAGTARGQQPGQLFVRDETGQATVLSPQTRVVPLGGAIEAVGTLAREGGEFRLRDSLFRSSTSAPPRNPEAMPKLRLADQLRELQPEEAAKGYPVQLSGIVTWARPNADFFYVHDSSGGVCVYRPTHRIDSMYVGTKVEITGISAPGKFVPVVLASAVQAGASIELPEARPITLEQALTGVEEAQWVSISGYVRGVVADGPWVRLELITSGGEFSVMLPPNDRWAKLPGAIIRVRGVCAAVANDKRQLVAIQVWVPSHRFVEIEEAPADLFATPLRPIASLRQFSTLPALNRRVRVAGTVIHQTAGRIVHLQEGADGLLVLSRAGGPLQPGDRIEAVGLPGRENSRVVLREAVYRRVATGAAPEPVRVARVAPIDAELDGRLVRVEGMLLSTGEHQTEVRMILQQHESIFEAVLERPIERPSAPWVPRTRLAVTGVYDIRFDEYRRPHAVRILLRDPADVEILQQPPWWTVRRALAATGVLACVVLLGFGWVVVLRRRVHHQTGVIREQVESEKAARLEAALARASKLESLGILAGGIAHDFNNLLTVVLGNLSLARLDPRVPADTIECLAESERAATRARDLTQQLLTFAKGGEPVRTTASLPQIVREAAEFGLHGSNVRCEFEVAPDLWPAHVDRGQTGQVVHNLIINASQAMPAGGIVRIRLQNEEIAAPRSGLAIGRYVRLTVTDTGHGIPAETISRIFEPYFTTKRHGNGLGLATVYSIVQKHQGHIEVTSVVGQGTSFDVWLPAAQATAAPAAEPVKHSAGPGRILLMDDEPSIRSLGAAVFRRMGLESTVVADGRAAVDAYAAARAAGRPYDLVILDLTVPGGMGGAEAMEQLRLLDPSVRAIVSSGYSKDPVMARYEQYGFFSRVPKPYQASELMAAVRAALERPSA